MSTSATCSSCDRTTPAVVVLNSPRGEYQLCITCFAPGKPPIATQRGKRR